MNKRMGVGMTLLMAGACIAVAGATDAGAKEQWRLGTQAYSFNRFTFYEAVAKTKSVGLKYVEAYPGQRISKEDGDATLDHNMSPALRLQVMEMLKEQGIKLVNYGVVALPNNEEECRKVFNFARDMGIETIVSEPPEDAFDLIDRLCQEYQIGVAIHNHPNPSHYWNPDTVMKVCEGRSKWIGACADTGHWMRSGIDPVEAVKKLGRAGRIRSLHFKDLNEFGNPDAHDVIWGTGVGKAGAVLAELASQKFDGTFSIEYEYHWDNSLPEIAGCVDWFNRTASDLGVSRWDYLFNGKDLGVWDGDPRLWSV
jgi:sugar phosphate isomerase/epimerase